MVQFVRALGLGVLLVAAGAAHAQTAPLQASDLAGTWLLTVRPKPNVNIKVKDSAGRLLSEMAFLTTFEVRDGKLVRCTGRPRAGSHPPEAVACALRKGALVLDVPSSANGQKARAKVTLARQASGDVAGSMVARAAVVPVSLEIGTATLTRER
jgi:hypothetical protein